MAGKARFEKRTFRLAVDSSRGIIANVAATLNCDRQTVYNYLKKWPEMQARLVEAREALMDVAENKLADLVGQGEIRAIIFTLETLGKARGYARRTELTGADGSDLLKLSPEITALLRQMNIEPSAVVAEFEALIRATAQATVPAGDV